MRTHTGGCHLTSTYVYGTSTPSHTHMLYTHNSCKSKHRLGFKCVHCDMQETRLQMWLNFLITHSLVVAGLAWLVFLFFFFVCLKNGRGVGVPVH